MQKRGKTRTRTFRFDVELLKRLGKAAGRMEISENELVVALLEERLLVDPLIPAFHGMTLDSDSIESFLVSANVDVLEAAFSEKAQRNFPLILQVVRDRRRTAGFLEVPHRHPWEILPVVLRRRERQGDPQVDGAAPLVRIEMVKVRQVVHR